MAASTVTPFRTPAPQGKASRKTALSRRTSRKLRRQGASAVGIGAVAVVLVALSLSHLAHGIAIVTGAPSWESWALAIGIDLGFVALELAQLAIIADAIRKQVAKFIRPTIVGTLAGSAAMNSFAFAAQATEWMLVPAIVMGIAIPAMVYSLTRVGATIYADTHARS
jgi:hypothetical protein